MNVISSSFTIAEYCDQMNAGQIVVNRDYQRSPAVWPVAAKSYLIDTILLGYPIPKISLYQKTDIRTRRTIKEIVDGQQRSQAILDYFSERMKITGKSDFSGQKLSQLDEEFQQRFLSYSLSVDVFINATDPEIRQVFRRMNSYTIPLNKQEQRHAVFQGELKWFIVELTDKFDQAMKDLGVFTEHNLGRMYDAALFSEIVYALLNGIESASDVKLDKLYKEYDHNFAEGRRVKESIEFAFNQIFAWPSIHGGPLMKPYNFYSLVTALCLFHDPNYELVEYIGRDQPLNFSPDSAQEKLSILAGALDGDVHSTELKPFIDACSEGTNRVNQRIERFRWFYRALRGGPL